MFFFMIWRPEVIPPCNSGSKRQKTKPLRLLEYLIKANFRSKFHRNRSTQVSNLWNTFSDIDTEKQSDIETKLREVQSNGSRLRTQKETLTKRRLKEQWAMIAVLQ